MTLEIRPFMALEIRRFWIVWQGDESPFAAMCSPAEARRDSPLLPARIRRYPLVWSSVPGG